ncbi:DUF4412 domain-containing protein [Pedobacter frigoris]|uniref:DUF4412 domain-containing protein n=1 Tax=Pedobacter frigoris TaxID=2571272 RepID=UPI00292CA791|nr:DUF4412 domain-containing protein [Pedobacter frigoris]
MFKSIKTGVVAIILISTAIIAKAQKVMDQGTLIYGIEYILTDEQKNAVDASMLPSESKVQFNGNISKVEVDLGAAMLKVFTDGMEKKALILVDIPIMQKQYAAKMSKEDLEKQSGNRKFSDFKATGEQQKIAGYNAEKYNYKDDNGGSYEVWVSKDIKFSAGATPPGFEDVKGTPVKFTNVQDGVKTVLTLKSLKEEKVGPFTLDVPKGYEEKTMAELKAMQGAQ